MRNDEILKRTQEGMKESNKILIRELIHDLEEKGISPVIGVNGEVKKLKLLNKVKTAWFVKEFKKFWLDKSDFCLLEEDCTKKPRTTKKIAESIILIHKKSAKIKTYKASSNSRWIADFHHDLENKFFTN